MNLRTEGDKLLAMIKKVLILFIAKITKDFFTIYPPNNIQNQDEGAGSLISKLCLKDPTSCQNMEQIPKEVEDFILVKDPVKLCSASIYLLGQRLF